MHWHQTLEQTTGGLEPLRTRDTRLQRYWLLLARGVWVALVLFLLVVFCMGIPWSHKLALSLRPETRAGLAQLGFSTDVPAFYLLILDTMTVLAFALFAVLIFWHRSDDGMVLFVGLMLLLTALLYTAPAFEAHIPLGLLALVAALAEISQVAFVYLFPDGRYVPRWTWILLPPLFIWRLAMWGLVYLPHFYSLQRSGENFYYVPQYSWDLMLLLALLALGIIAQVYRYHHYSTLVQQQQAKWLVLGVIIAVTVMGSYAMALNTLAVLQQLGSDALLVRLLSRIMSHLALLLIPVTLTFSILRYQLWHIDVLINRTLVYGTLTGTLAVIYLGLVLVLQYSLRDFLGGNQLAIVGSTLVIVLLFQPLRHRIKMLIDRRFYRRKYDAARTLAEFSVVLREEVDLTQLSERLITVVEETMQPTQVSLWLRQPEPQTQERSDHRGAHAQ